MGCEDLKRIKYFNDFILSFDSTTGRLCTVAMDRTIKNN